MQWWLGALLIGTSFTVLAETGRYQAVVIREAGAIHQPGAPQGKVLILDTVEGHLWTWSERELVKGGHGASRFNSVLNYEGQVRAGQSSDSAETRQ